MDNKLYNLTNPQKSILLTEEYYKGTNINNICGIATISEVVDFNLLKKAINVVVKNNDSFNFKLVMDNNEMKQYLGTPVDIKVEIVDISSKDEIANIANELMNHVFDIYNSDLFCFKIFRFKDGTGGFMLNIHHLFADSWTLGLTAREIVRTYSCLKNGNEVTKNDDFSYLNYIYSEEEYKNSDKFKKDKEYWENIFNTIPEQATIPSSKEEIANDFSSKGNRKIFNIDKDEMDKFNKYAQENSISIFNFFMAIYAIYLGRVSNLDDFVIGTPILNRTNFKEKNTTGMFINTAPLRITIDDSMSFKSFVSNIAKDSLGMLRHQKYYYQNIIEDLRKKDANLPNLYNVLISYQVTKANTESGLSYTTSWAFNGNCADDIDIHLYDINDSGSLDVAYDYKISKYDDNDIVNIHNRIMHIAKQILDNNEITLKDIEIVTPEEKKEILYKFNDIKAEYPKDKTVVDLFEEQVEKKPNHIAVVFGDDKLTYRELNEKANQLAHYLVENGVKNEEPVGIFMDKSLEMIIAILAILKAGACYLPIDINYPKTRIDYMIKDSDVKIVLSSKTVSNMIDANVKIINIDLSELFYCNYSTEFSLSFNVLPSNLAYIMYTSGSTGNPKGVMIEQKSIIRLVKNPNFITFNEDDKILQTGSIVFDACTFEIWAALLNGLELYIIKKEDLLNISQFDKFLQDYKITILWLTSPLFNQICEQKPNVFKNVRCLLTGGDVLSCKHINIARTANPNLTIINGYGPTENTTFSCCYTIHDTFTNSIPIGKPISGSYCYIVSKSGNLQPIGVPGELWVSGDGVARGYLNNNNLNDKVFKSTGFTNSRIYKTGDLVKWLPDGNIEFIGRADNQVKIRGFRVELNEISSKILQFGNIKECITVIYNNENNKYICSYVVFRDKDTISELRDYLRKNLPSYMIPTYIIPLEVLPININGKVDKKLLPVPTTTQSFNCDSKPRNTIDSQLLTLVKSVLNVDCVDLSISFLEVGGDSLSSIKLSTEIFNKLHANISVKDIMTSLSLYELSDKINSSYLNDNIPSIFTAEKQDFYPLSSAQKRIYYECKKLGDNTLTYNISGGLLVDKILDKTKIINVINTLVERHSIFRTNFVYIDNEIKQVIKDNVNINIPVFEDKTENLNNILNSFQKPFNFEKDILLRVSIYYLDKCKTLILIDSHHIALDGVSLNIFMKEFCKLYNNELLPELKIDYKDFSVWEQDFINSDKIKPLEEYWLNKFKDSSIPAVNLPYDYVNLNTTNSIGNRVNYKMNLNDFKKIENTAKTLNISSYSFFLSVLFILLYKYTQQEELIVGSATVGRENNELYDIVGDFVNNIVIDAKMRNNQSFNDFSKYINNQVMEDLSHEAYPYDLLVKKLSSLNSNCKNSIFDVSFTYQNANTNDFIIDNEIIKVLNIYSNTNKFNLLLEIQPKDGTFSFEYNASLFKDKTIKSLLDHYLFILNQIVNNTDIVINDINILTNDEAKLLDKFNNTYEIPNDDTMVSLFEKEVKNNSDNIALICEDKFLTYNELNIKANSLAHYLIQHGIGANDIVCIMTNRSLETIVCMLGILKAGACFFNVDPTYPIERTKYYIENSKTKYVLTQKELKYRVSQIENCIEIDLDNENIYGKNFENPNVKIGMNDLSYIIYTSGSTGTPKGVMLNQIGLANMIKAMTKVLDYLKEGNRHTIVSVTSTPFDIFVYEIVVSLAHGLKVVMANNAEHRNPKLLDALIRKYNVDVMTVTPSLMKINYDNREPNSALALVKNMVFGGEPLPEKFVNDLKALADDITIYNIYGPSEITVLSNVQNLDGESEITVGPPIMNTQIHILDKNMNRVPIGVVGEIYISGIQVGLGYIGKPEMTAEKFLDNPFGNGKIYKSGDIGRWTFDGKVQVLGRIDHQIKLRGLRIELGEIENVMNSVKGVVSSVVNKINIDDREALCGYYVADNTVLESTIKDALRNSLPPYMVPTYIVRLDEMPYTINRKIDRKALPLPQLNKNTAENKVNIAALNSNEEKLLQIWKNILKVDNISINDNFFDIGGDSISAISMQIEALKYGLNFEYADIFNYPTIEQLSHKLPSPIEKFMEDYDYSKVNEVLKRNTVENINTIKEFDLNNILLIGSTGYLGAHVIDEFLKNTNANIYCLIRKKNEKLPLDRLREILNFYFKDTYDNEIGNRIKVICGDITKNDLGLSDIDYKLLSDKIDTVINSGAIVKHFGLKEEFENINVIGTKNVVDFCMKNNKRLLHISTISISGNGEKDETIEETPENINNKKQFYEKDIYIKQNISGIYTTTKYRAELIVLEAIYNGLNAQILRLGNITNRYSDGLFQLNVEDNAFAKRLKSFIEIGAFPKYLLQHAIELTPVDLAANAILKIATHSSICNVFHIYNPKLLPVQLLVDTLSSIDIELEGVSNKLFENIINGILNDDSQKDILSGIIYDFDKESRLIYTSNVRIKYDFTEQYLNKIGFYWKEIDKQYILKYMDYFKKIKFI